MTAKISIIILGLSHLVSAHNHGHSHAHDAQGALASCIHFCQEYLFPFNAKYNSLLATVIIQILPFLIIYCIPGSKSTHNSDNLTGSVNLLVAFAMGTLLGDIFLHLLPEAFSAIDTQDGKVAHQQYINTGSAIFCGFMIFFMLEKSMRILFLGTGKDVSLTSHSHSHSDLRSHSHSHDHSTQNDEGTVSSGDQASTLKQRKKRGSRKDLSMNEVTPTARKSKKSKQSTTVYLNIVSGFIHNITDGVTLASSFYSGKNVGVTTTIAILCHEIPHELGDFAILTSNGFTFSQALKSQLINAMGSLTGTAIGCAINEFPTQSDWKHWSKWYTFTTNLPNLRLPLTTGGFLYIVTMGVVPSMLSTATKDKCHEFKIWVLQLLFISIGFSLMALLASNE